MFLHDCISSFYFHLLMCWFSSILELSGVDSLGEDRLHNKKELLYLIMLGNKSSLITTLCCPSLSATRAIFNAMNLTQFFLP